MTESFAGAWLRALYALLERDRRRATELREASLAGDLSTWTRALTEAVVGSLQELGYSCAAKGHRCKVWPVARQEYLGQDVMAFESGDVGWRIPSAAIELENARRADRIAYSLWKVLNVRAPLRAVLCYRPDLGAGTALVGELTASVIQPLPIAERLKLGGETLVVVGTRGEAASFPFSFFRAWRLDPNTAEFRPFSTD